jgi:hypothetical protein
MSRRENLLEEFGGDLEYHPKRGAVYLVFATAATVPWLLSPLSGAPGTLRFVFVTGGLGLLAKGVFLFRKSSEGLALTALERDQLSDASRRKPLPAVPEMLAQITQDFGIAVGLLSPVLSGLRNKAANEHHSFVPEFLIGVSLFFAGWLVRRYRARRPGKTGQAAGA